MINDIQNSYSQEKQLSSLFKIPFLLFSILPSAISTFLGTWFLFQYQQPQVVYYADGYYSKINGLLIGSIFVVNEGRSPATNINFTIDEKISPSDISVDYLSIKAETFNDEFNTRIAIPRLQPHEYAEIVFRSRAGNKNFEIENITCDSENIKHEEWVKKSWRSFTKQQLAIIWFAIAFAFGLGTSIGWTGRAFSQKKKRTPRKPKVVGGPT